MSRSRFRQRFYLFCSIGHSPFSFRTDRSVFRAVLTVGIPAVGEGLEDRFRDVLRRAPHIQSGLDVEPELFRAVEDCQDGDGDQLPRLMGDLFASVQSPRDKQRQFPAQFLIKGLPEFKGFFLRNAPEVERGGDFCFFDQFLIQLPRSPFYRFNLGRCTAKLSGSPCGCPVGPER